MTTQRRCYETGHKPKCLVIVDDTAEWDRAVYYASRWAIRAGGGVVILRIVEVEDHAPSETEIGVNSTTTCFAIGRVWAALKRERLLRGEKWPSTLKIAGCSRRRRPV